MKQPTDMKELEEELYEVDDTNADDPRNLSPTPKDVVSPEFKSRVERQDRIRVLSQGIRHQDQVISTLGSLKLLADDQSSQLDHLTRRNELLEARLSGFDLIAQVLDLSSRGQSCDNNRCAVANGYSPEYTRSKAGELLDDLIGDLRKAEKERDALRHAQEQELQEQKTVVPADAC